MVSISYIYGIHFFEVLADIINTEPVLEQDKSMLGLLAGIGIKKGQPFNPDVRTTRALEEAIALAYDSMQSFFTTPGKALVPFWDNSRWQIFNFAKGQAQAGFPYVTDERVLIDERAGGSYFWISYLPKNLGGGTFYLTSLRDSSGELFDATSTYRLRVPPDVPARDFWSAIVYSMASKAFISSADQVGISSLEMDSLIRNDDGSTDIFFAPVAPAGFEQNWIPTGESFFLIFRLYGPLKPLFAKSWMLGDVEKLPTN